MAIFKHLFIFSIISISILTLSGCGKIAPKHESAEAVVQTFYNYMIQGKQREAKELIDQEIQKTEQFVENWETIKEWTFHSAEVQEVDGEWVKIFMKVEYQGQIVEQVFEVRAQEKDGEWWIIYVPN